MKRLALNEFIEYAPEEPGMVRVNHNSLDCAGDSKSMRVTRADDGVVYAKCYRCGGMGRYAEGESKYSAYSKAKKSKKVYSGKVNNLSLPHDFSMDLSKFPLKVKSKLYRYFIHEEDIKEYGIGWSEKLNRLILPVYYEGELVGWQGRSYVDGEVKYITKYKQDSDLFVYIPCKDESKHCAIVEDMFSCIRVSKYVNGLALLGNSISDKALLKVIKKNDKFLVYLDHDNRQVIMNTIQIRERLHLLGKYAKVISSEVDPKELTPPSLKSLLLDSLGIPYV